MEESAYEPSEGMKDEDEDMNELYAVQINEDYCLPWGERLYDAYEVKRADKEV